MGGAVTRDSGPDEAPRSGARRGRSSVAADPEFRRLWAGETASHLGTFVGSTVVPLLAVQTLAASSLEMGLLSAARNGGFLLIGLQAGVWVDRMQRRRMMLQVDLVRAVLLFTVPVAWWLGMLTFAQLLAVSLLLGLCTVFFDVAYQSYLPSLVPKSDLVEGNAKLESSRTVASIGGPGLGGPLVSIAGAANAVIVSTAGYLLSALWLWRIRTPEPPIEPRPRARMRVEIAEGASFVLRSPTLRAILACSATSNLFSAAFFALQVLYLVDDAELSTSLVGVVMAGTGIGGVLGALTARRWTGGLGLERAICYIPLFTFGALVLLPLGRADWAVLPAMAGLAIFGYGVTVYNVAQVSHRQEVCPDQLLGRMNAGFRFVGWGTLPVGALLGGALGEVLGIRETLFLAAAGTALAPLWVIFSPLRAGRP